MRILIEEYHYKDNDRLRELLAGSGITPKQVENDTRLSLDYVGYFYNSEVQDVVCILPKVLMNESNSKVCDLFTPEELMEAQPGEKGEEVRKMTAFVRGFAVWMYRAISVYRKKNPDSDITQSRNITQMGHGRKREQYTLLDVLLELLQYNKDNRDYVTFVLKNQHRGLNKINWTKTINKSQAVVQNGTPVYLNPVNRKKQVNFDEELLVIYYSILNYIGQTYGFAVELNMNFDLIKGHRFEHYMEGYGTTRLKAIKYKYFDDRSLRMWDLCYAFFDAQYKVKIHADTKDYLLAHDFDRVFEDMIDELIGDEECEGLKKQEDNKMLDHIYRYYGLMDHVDKEKNTYYIGDSKYYKRGSKIDGTSVAKQYTYARNLVQHNLNLFLDGKTDRKEYQQYRDEDTEGYDIVPNFFISARVEDVSKDGYKDSRITLVKTPEEKTFHVSRQFENRLYDRDTILVARYDVNFLYVIALYARNRSSEQASWQKVVRDQFRKEIRDGLQAEYDFFAMTPRDGVNDTAYIVEHFQQMLGKVYRPFPDDGETGQKYYSLALDKNEEFAEDNQILRSQLEGYFHVKECSLGKSPYDLFEKRQVIEAAKAPLGFLTMHYLERYKEDRILVGFVKSKQHWDWIMGKNDKGTNIYNVRIDKNRPGAEKQSVLAKLPVGFAVLYEQRDDGILYRVFRVHHHAIMNKERILQSWYPAPSAEKYFCYVFSEEVTLGELDIAKLIEEHKNAKPDYVDGAPIFVSGEEMLKYRTALLKRYE